jgi:hypothetical protein
MLTSLLPFPNIIGLGTLLYMGFLLYLVVSFLVTQSV